MHWRQYSSQFIRYSVNKTILWNAEQQGKLQNEKNVKNIPDFLVALEVALVFTGSHHSIFSDFPSCA